MMKHKANSMAVWYVDFRVLNDMMGREEWYSHLQKPEQPGVIETGDDTSHTIEHVSDIPLKHVRQKGKLMNVMHVPTITKNLVSVI